jgi:hypothetical protein
MREHWGRFDKALFKQQKSPVQCDYSMFFGKAPFAMDDLKGKNIVISRRARSALSLPFLVATVAGMKESHTWVTCNATEPLPDSNTILVCD